MFSALFLLAASFGATYERSIQVAEVALWVAQRHDPSTWFPSEPDEHFARYRMAALLVSMAFHESSFDPRASGDSGRACGIMQVHPRPNGPSCAAMKASAWIAMDEGARRITESVAQCGSLRAGLGAYVSGHCGWARSVVERRCKDAGRVCE